ncbi:hypothetical protein [Streptomyces sp. TLI_171]|uniref:hypothetical protein n=1 Tax=Streptomyces sp. TLI_171 TaxID=1938859 RepID=UPI000C5C015A|nr:hypothetical protein [Streptomyces sp. TLI_171]RKE19138.1 hypothetical protein BX266_2445 [Streptomyces sp. TLI_171]
MDGGAGAERRGPGYRKRWCGGTDRDDPERPHPERPDPEWDGSEQVRSEWDGSEREGGDVDR